MLNKIKNGLVGWSAKTYLTIFGYPDIGTHLYFPHVTRFLNPSVGEKILDAGCGNGFYINILSKRFSIEGWGIDINKIYLKRAQFLAKIFKVTSQFKEMNLTDLRLSNGFFDKAICLQALQFIDDDKRAIREIGRVLKKGGVLVLGFPGEKYYNQTQNSKKLLTMRVKRRGYSLEKMQKLLLEQNFKILQKKIVIGPFFKKLVSIQSYFYLKNLEFINLAIFPLLGWLAMIDLSLAKANKEAAIYLLKAQKI